MLLFCTCAELMHKLYVLLSGIRSMGFVSSPLIRMPRRSVTGLIHVTDWLPTLLTIAGGTTQSLDIDGINQWNAISNDVPSKRAVSNVKAVKKVAIFEEKIIYRDFAT